MKEGAWINPQTGQMAWIDEHASWLQREPNAKQIGLSDSVYQTIRGMSADFNGEGRVGILAEAMRAGLIRMRGHGSYWTFEFTIKTSDVLWACLAFLNDYAGPYTNCRFNNLRTGEQIEMNYREFKESMEEDPERVMRVASVMTDEQHPRRASFQEFPTVGLNVNDKDQPYTRWILDGSKTIETRNKPTLSTYLDEWVGLVRTGKGPATLVGYCVLGEPICYEDNEAFRADQDQHRVPPGSTYDIPEGRVKYGYPILQVKACKPERVGFDPREGRTYRTISLLDKQARPVPVPNQLVIAMVRYIGDLFDNQMYRWAEPQQRLAEVLTREYTVRAWAGDLRSVPFPPGAEGFDITFVTNPNKQVAEGKPIPVFYEGGFRIDPEQPEWLQLQLVINGTLTLQQAMEQFDPEHPEFRHLCTIIRHELTHAFDPDYLKDHEGITSQEQLDDSVVYHNMPTEVKAWTGNLIDEFEHFVKGKPQPGNELVDPFLRESRVWALISQHLNSANRRFVLHELSEEVKAHGGSANAQSTSKVDTGTP